MELFEHIRRERRERGSSLRELARRTHISSGYLSQLISGTRFPSAAVRTSLQEELGVTQFEDLFLLEKTGEETTDT